MTLTEARALIKGLPPGLIKHIERARRLSRELAKAHGLSPLKAALAILLHDMARSLEETELVKLAEAFGIDITESDLNLPLLLHGPVGAELLKGERGLKDLEILEAISCHTTGKPGMGKLAKVVFLADKLESDKSQESPELERVKKLAYKDLDRAMLAYLFWHKDSLAKRGLPLHPLTQKTLEHLIESGGRRQEAGGRRQEARGWRVES